MRYAYGQGVLFMPNFETMTVSERLDITTKAFELLHAGDEEGAEGVGWRDFDPPFEPHPAHQPLAIGKKTRFSQNSAIKAPRD